MTRSRFIVSSWVLCVALAGGTATAHQAVPPSLEAILTRLEASIGDLRSLETSFTQEKSLALFDQTMVLTGKAYMQSPELFAWHVAEPLRYSLVISGNEIRQWDEDTDDVQEISLGGRPGFEAAIGQMQLWFSGEARALLPDYEGRLIQQDPVVLEFVPRRGNIAAEVITSVRLEFRQDASYIQRITMLERNGDSMTLTFSDVRKNEPIDSSAWEVRRRAR